MHFTLMVLCHRRFILIEKWEMEFLLLGGASKGRGDGGGGMKKIRIQRET